MNKWMNEWMNEWMQSMRCNTMRMEILKVSNMAPHSRQIIDILLCCGYDFIHHLGRRLNVRHFLLHHLWFPRDVV